MTEEHSRNSPASGSSCGPENRGYVRGGFWKAGKCVSWCIPRKIQWSPGTGVNGAVGTAHAHEMLAKACQDMVNHPEAFRETRDYRKLPSC